MPKIRTLGCLHESNDLNVDSAAAVICREVALTACIDTRKMASAIVEGSAHLERYLVRYSGVIEITIYDTLRIGYGWDIGQTCVFHYRGSKQYAVFSS